MSWALALLRRAPWWVWAVLAACAICGAMAWKISRLEAAATRHVKALHVAEAQLRADVLTINALSARALRAEGLEARAAEGAAKACAADVTGAFNSGVAVGRAVCKVKPNDPVPAVARPAGGGAGDLAPVVRDYRSEWEAGAYRP